MVGGNASFKGIVGTSVLKVFDLEVARTGLSETDAKIERFQFYLQCGLSRFQELIIILVAVRYVSS